MVLLIDTHRVHCIALLLLLLQFQKVLCFASFKSSPSSTITRHHDDDASAEQISLGWILQSKTDSISTAIQDCTELYEAIDNCSDLSQWVAQRGISKKRLVGMISRHPLLLARAITSRNVQVVYMRSWHVLAITSSNSLTDICYSIVHSRDSSFKVRYKGGTVLQNGVKEWRTLTLLDKTQCETDLVHFHE